MEIINLEEIKHGQKMWICDIKLNDSSKKLIFVRNLKPTEVTVDISSELRYDTYRNVLREKNTYYHFTNNKGKLIKFYANVYNGYGFYMFDNKEECVKKYKELAENIQTRLEKDLEEIHNLYKKRIKEITII